jgi:hypothetical protein
MVAVVGKDKRLTRQAMAMGKRWLTAKKPAKLPKGMLGSILRVTAIEGGHATWELMKKKLATTKKARQRRALISAMGSTRDPKALAENMKLFVNGKIGLRESVMLMVVPLGHPKTRAIFFPLILKHWKDIAAKIPALAHARLLGVAGALCTKKEVALAEKELQPKAKSIMGGPQALGQALEQAKLCIAFRDKQKASLAKFLRRY